MNPSWSVLLAVSAFAVALDLVATWLRQRARRPSGPLAPRPTEETLEDSTEGVAHDRH
jgi:hypothetical protein